MGSRAEWLHAGLVLILWVSFARQIVVVGARPRTIEQRSTCAAIGLFALAMTLLVPALYLFVDRLTGIPNSSRLLANCLGILSGWAISPVRLRALRRREGTGLLGSVLFLLAVLAVEAALFFLARTDESIPGNFAERYASVGAIVAYRAVLMAYVGAVMGQLFWASWEHRASTRAIRDRYRRLRGQMQLLGWGCGTAYAIHEAIFPLLARGNIALPTAVHTGIEYTLLSGFVVLLLGSGSVSLAHWLARYRAYRRLYPLWRDMRAIVPAIVNNNLDTPPDTALRDALITDDLDRRTHERVTELADGLLALRQYADSPIVRNVRERCVNSHLPPELVEATTDAAIVTAACHRPAPMRTDAVDTPYTTRGSGDPEREQQYFLEVAWAYQHSLIIKQSLREAGGTGTQPPTLPHPRGAR